MRIEKSIRSPIILASVSPRRREILERLGFEFEIIPADLDEESIRHADTEERTCLLARAKAGAVALTGRLTVAADTVVVLDGAVLEKPKSSEDARRMLQELSGRDHLVLTGVCVIFPQGQSKTLLEKTRVFFSPLKPDAIASYVATAAPYDKAGGYGVQDSFGMTNIYRIEGCYFNVMGFPASRFMQLLSENQKFLL